MFIFIFGGLGLVRDASAVTKCPVEKICHNVQKNDSLSKIARQHGVSLTALVNANPEVKNRHLIKVGWAIRMPQAQKQVKTEETGSAKGVERSGNQPASDFSASSVDALKKEIDELRKHVASLTHAQAETSVQLKELQRTYQEIARLKQENEALRKGQEPSSVLVTVTDDPVPIENQEVPLAFSVLCASVMALIFVKLHGGNYAMSGPREHIPSKLFPVRHDKVVALYKKAEIIGGTPPWVVDTKRIRDPPTLIIIKEHPELFKRADEKSAHKSIYQPRKVV